ncbi:FHA domain-containing protein DDL isoform X2 [Primulina tabacum]
MSPKPAPSRSPTPLSPIKEKTSSRSRSSKQGKSRSSVSRSPQKVNLSNIAKSAVSGRSKSPIARSPSPRSKRLKRGKVERDVEKGGEKEHDKNHGRNGDRATHKERDYDRALPIQRSDKRLGRDAIDNGSSKSRRGRSGSPTDNRRKGQHRSRSPSATDDRARDERAYPRNSEQRNGDNDSLAKMKAAEDTLEAKEKQKPSFELSGKLAAETNRYRGITLLFNEAPDARKPDIRWRLYVFKGGEVLNEPLYVHRQSCYLFGRERRVADIPTDHPSCSKQHAVLQYRQVEQENPDGTMSKKVRPYVMDLGSTNGTFINDNQIEPQRYYELIEKDTLKFGNSSREYVLLHENSA